MRKVTLGIGMLFLSLLLDSAAAQAQNDTLRVLFVGNSHTYTNNLPQLFADLSASGGHPVVKDMSAIGGYTLEQHSTNPTTLGKISQGTWDYVVLQEHSLYPVIDFYRYGSFYPSARLLDSLITNYGEQTALFMTWGWRYGGRHEVNGYPSPDFVDYFEMQDSVSAACVMLADELEALLSPAGNAWATARTRDSTINLWQSDNYHPTLPGSYLAACVFYATFFNESPVGLPYTAGLSPEQAAFLQLAAWDTYVDVADDPETIPSSFELKPNYPNPFNAQTTIRYSLSRSSDVVIDIFDLLGRKLETVFSGYQAAGLHHVNWDARDASSGTYFYRLHAGESTSTSEMLLLK